MDFLFFNKGGAKGRTCSFFLVVYKSLKEPVSVFKKRNKIYKKRLLRVLE